ncbi:MAG: hypothetical protein MUE67_05210 [Anaerolineales bacterium]|jgi:hypothetical protein|nr:hypothetical protein [Anaerolineales bacterium]
MRSLKLPFQQFILLILCLGLSSCQFSSGPVAPTVKQTSLAAAPATPTFTATRPVPPTQRPLPSPTTPNPTATLPVFPTATQTALASPTGNEATELHAEVVQQAHCRYGPGTAFLHSDDLYPGERAGVDGRNDSGTWLWIKPDDIDRHCWAAASVLRYDGQVNLLPVVTSKLPYSNLYGPPQNVQTARDGDQVIIAWDPLPFTEDDFRGYMLQLDLCQGGQMVTVTLQTNDTQIGVTDELSCGGGSGGRLWGVEKHGYTQSVEVIFP